ncbi:Diphosphomevalonate decarboxylase [Plasmodiophora brassicae]|uniref:Diphosphomevalonate decarboxylase n=1 Tax=Plasmodiophora brassicae TaxID=37360 RepID=A0A0G4IXA8_PLABS|nr:hypothetical protein PBRA_007699 [Plasmodiophora brassicae]SPQ99596.1 unnamed protein product [Plasmodiophora brassicae]
MSAAMGDDDGAVVVSCRAPINMAVLKYWGKRDERLVLPLHASLSLTLHVDCMASSITVAPGPDLAGDEMLLNGTPCDLDGNARLQAVLQACRRLSTKSESFTRQPIRLECRNDFPTAAGLASSASGLACLTSALMTFYSCRESFPGEATTIARQGSGSACRSMFGGFVTWEKGSDDATGHDSVARQFVDESHWSDLRVVILVVSSGEKEVGSTMGMRRSVETSELLAYRAGHVVEPRMQAFKSAIKQKDFGEFAELVMRDSNQFHAVCADTYPPVFYLNDVSHAIIDAVHAFNHDRIRAAYTFDAGPNACLFTREQDLPDLLSSMVEAFAPDDAGDRPTFVRDPLRLCPDLSSVRPRATRRHRHRVRQIIVTKGGPGPQISTKVVP